MNERAVFSNRSVGWLSAAGGGSFLLAIGLVIFGGEPPAPWVGPGARSTSALGHSALLALLDDLGRPATAGRHLLEHADPETSLFVFAEPVPDQVGAEELREGLKLARHALLILPKRIGWPDPDRPAWVRPLSVESLEGVQRLLKEAGVQSEVVRLPTASETGSWTGVDGVGTPALPAPQLLRSDALEPVYACEAGILAGILRTPQLTLGVLSDPDLIANAGLGLKDNAALAVNLLDRLRAPGRQILFDERLHGDAPPPSVWRELGKFPLVLVLAHACLALAALLWAGAARFGAPSPRPPPIPPGKGWLVDNVAELLRSGGHGALALKTWFADRVRAATTDLRAPSGLDPAGQLEWLAQRGRRRGLSPPLEDLAGMVAEVSQARRTEPRALLALARRIHVWTTEVVHGSR